MPSIIEIRNRISSIKKTKKITQALKMVSAAKFHRGQILMNQVRPYAEHLSKLVDNVLIRTLEKDHYFFESPNTNEIILVVIAADRGLAGSFNHSVFRAAGNFLNDHKDKQISIITVGTKAYNFIKKQNYNVLKHYNGFFDEISFKNTRNIAKEIIALFNSGKYSEVHLVYNEFISAINQEVSIKKLLPVEHHEEHKELILSDYIYEPTMEHVIDSLLNQSLNYSLYKIIISSFTAEQSARMTAMEAATDNAQDMIASLTLTYNRIRQATITKELAEIVGGAEALSQ